MKVRYTADRTRYKTMTTAELRESFLIDGLFRENALALEYCETERAVVGSAVPLKAPIKLEAGKELAANYFCERREAGVLNIGGPGKISVDGADYPMEKQDCLYIGRGSREVAFHSSDPKMPAKFYIISYPAHADYPTKHAKKADASPVTLGSKKEANARTIYKLIHTDGIKSCQLVMGYTELDEGSVWNTMPAHTHERRTEVYLYFNMDPKDVVFHLMGPADETRHIVLRNGQAVVSPMWSIHSGVGSAAYTFCWGMGGENQEFNDMDAVGMESMA